MRDILEALVGRTIDNIDAMFGDDSVADYAEFVMEDGTVLTLRSERDSHSLALIDGNLADIVGAPVTATSAIHRLNRFDAWEVHLCLATEHGTATFIWESDSIFSDVFLEQTC